MKRIFPAAFLCVVGASCGHSTPSTERPVEQGNSMGGSPVPQTTYYTGMIINTSPDGTVERQMATLKREMHPAQGRIVEHSLVDESKSGRWSWESRVAVYSRIGDGQRFEVKEQHGLFNGRAVFSGDEWRWNEWKIELTLATGGTVSGTGSLVWDDRPGAEQECLVVKSRQTDENGAEVVAVRAVFEPAEVKHYETLKKVLTTNIQRRTGQSP